MCATLVVLLLLTTATTQQANTDASLDTEAYIAQARDRTDYYLPDADNRAAQGNSYWLIIPYVNGWLEAISIGHILTDVQHLQPFTPDVVIRWTYPTPNLNERINDYHALSDSIDFDAWSFALFPLGIDTPTPYTKRVLNHTPCICHDFHASDGSSNLVRCDGHVVSGTPAHYTNNAVFLDRLNRGSTFREPPAHADFNLAFTKLGNAIDDLISDVVRTDGYHAITYVALHNWKEHILSHFYARYIQIRNPDHISSLTHIYSRPPGSWYYTYVNVVQPLQSLFTFTVSDKARGNMVATCRNYYVATTVMMISGQHAYYERVEQLTSVIHEQLMHKMHNVLKPNHIPEMSHARWAYFYILPKLHKTPVKWRPIVAAHNCSITTANRVLASMLRLTLTTLQTHYTQEFRHTKIRKLWLIENSLEFVLARPERIDHVFSSDINSMYTELNQDFVIDAVTREISNAASIANSPCMSVKIHNTKYGNRADNASWSGCHRHPVRPNIGIYHIHDIPALLQFVVKHVYFTVGNALFHQIKGLPMGGNPSSFLANIALFHLERLYVEHNPHTSLQYNIYRYLDDYCVTNYPEFALPENYRAIYPEYTGVQIISNTVQLDHNVRTRADFLDLSIWVTIDPQEVYISLHDKRTSFGFHIIKFPHEESNTYTPQARSTYFTELVRLYRINTHTLYFINNALDLTMYCIQYNGYQPIALLVQFLKFISKIRYHNHLRPRTTTWLHIIQQFTSKVVQFLMQPTPV